MIEIKKISSELEFTNLVKFFTDDSKESERLYLYRSYASENQCKEDEAKDKILKTIFSDYINSQMKEALYLANNESYNAYTIIDKLEILRPIFKDYDLNTFSSFVASVEIGLSRFGAEVLLNNDCINQEFVDSLTKNIIGSLSNPTKKPSNIDEYILAYNDHPLLNCLQNESEPEKVLKYIEDGVLDVGVYKQLISLVLKLRNKDNNEKIDFFISYLINEDLTKGLYSIYKEDEYNPYELKSLLVKVAKGEQIWGFEVENLVNKISYKSVTLKNDSSGELNKANSSKGTLNDSGLEVKFGDLSYFVHIHSAQGKGENQNGQQATTTNTLALNNIDSISISLVKKNAGKDNHHNDFCKEYGLNLSVKESVLVTNMQFDMDYLEAIYGSFEDRDLKTSKILSRNFRIIKDSVKSSTEYNKGLIGMSDEDVIKNKAQLYFGFIKKHKDDLIGILSNTDSQNDVSSQLLGKPLLKSIELFFKLETDIRFEKALFNAEQVNFIQEFINEIGNSKSIIIGSSMREIKREIKNSNLNRDVDLSEFNRFNNIINAENDKKIISLEKTPEELREKETATRIRKIKKILKDNYGGTGLAETLKALDKGDFQFNEGNYSNSKSVDYYMASHVNTKKNQTEDKDSWTQRRNLEAINLLCEYANLKGRRIYSFRKDYTSSLGIKP